MKIKTETRTESNTPIYCQECHSQNSFVRDDNHSTKSGSGKLLWIGYTCRKCNNLTIRPASTFRPSGLM
jgi:hypothetical protein